MVTEKISEETGNCCEKIAGKTKAPVGCVWRGGDGKCEFESVCVCLCVCGRGKLGLL